MTTEQKEKVDQILEQCAKLFCNLGSDSTTEERKEAKRKEWEVLEELRVVDPEGYKFHLQTRDK